MISCDTNILYAALDSLSTSHLAARAFLTEMHNNTRFAVCELVLIELYGLLRNPAVSRTPCTASEATRLIQHFRAHPRWAVLDYPGPQAGIMTELWQRSGKAEFPYRRIFDARLALTLRHHGVTQFATRNIKDFRDFGFENVWDPTLT